MYVVCDGGAPRVIPSHDEAVNKLKFGGGLITRMEVSYAVIRAVACIMLGCSIHKPDVPVGLITPLKIQEVVQL